MTESTTMATGSILVRPASQHVPSLLDNSPTNQQVVGELADSKFLRMMERLHYICTRT